MSEPKRKFAIYRDKEGFRILFLEDELTIDTDIYLSKDDFLSFRNAMNEIELEDDQFYGVAVPLSVDLRETVFGSLEQGLSGTSTIRGGKIEKYGLLEPQFEVFISIPQDTIKSETIEKLLNAVGQFMIAMGFQLKEEGKPIIGSFFQKLLFVLSIGKSVKEVVPLFQKGFQALQYVLSKRRRDSDISIKLMKATAELIDVCRHKNVDSLFLQLGQILCVKVTLEGKANFAVIEITRSLEKALKEDPQLQKKPLEMYKRMIQAGASSFSST